MSDGGPSGQELRLPQQQGVGGHDESGKKEWI